MTFCVLNKLLMMTRMVIIMNNNNNKIIIIIVMMMMKMMKILMVMMMMMIIMMMTLMTMMMMMTIAYLWGEHLLTYPPSHLNPNISWVVKYLLVRYRTCKWFLWQGLIHTTGRPATKTGKQQLERSAIWIDCEILTSWTRTIHMYTTRGGYTPLDWLP